MTDEYAEVWSYLSDGIRPERAYSVSEWADAFRVLPQSTSSEHGPWRTSRVPYMREVMDALSSSSPWRTVVLMKAAQVGGSECGYNWLGYIMDVAPGPTMLVMPTEDTARKAINTRIEPMIQATPALADRVREGKERGGASTTNLKEFPGGFLALAWSKSAATLKSMPIRYLLLDEIDEYPANLAEQGDAVELAIARTTTFGSRKKIFMPSTPTVKGTSRVEAAYNQSQRMRLWVPCLHCGGYQVLKWKQIHWNAGDPANAWYVCVHCGTCIQNHEKTEMLARYEWRPDNPNYRGDTIGFHLPGFYSPVGMMSWGDIATKWVEAAKDENAKRAVYNTMFGEPYELVGEAPEWARLAERAEVYDRGTVPGGGLVLTAGADVQADRIEVEVVAWGRGRESWSVDYFVFPGDTSSLEGEAWKGLDDLLGMTFEHESGTMLSIRALAVDSGYNTQTVYNWCRKYSTDRVFPVKGSSTARVLLSSPKAVDAYEGDKAKGMRARKRIRRAVKLWTVGVDLVKTEFYGWLRQGLAVDVDDPDLVVDGDEDEDVTGGPGFCHFPTGYEDEHYRQLTAEHIEETALRGGRVRREWCKHYERNERLDCRVYARAAAALKKLDMFQARHWDVIEDRVWGGPRRALEVPVRTAVIGTEAETVAARPVVERQEIPVRPAAPVVSRPPVGYVRPGRARGVLSAGVTL